MTRIMILSDLHLEFGPFKIPNIPRDLLILAGDVGLGYDFLPFIKNACKKSPIIYVLGNHEGYSHDFDAVYKYWCELQLTNLYVLENKVIEFNDLRILGATLWTDMKQGNPKTIENAQYTMNDYTVVNKGNRPLSPHDTIKKFAISKKFIETTLDQPYSGKTIVVTHHLPSYRSVAEQFEGDPLNPAYASNLDDLILKTQPALWIHGHTHLSFDYMLGKTRVLCNPRGYVNVELNPNFNPKLVVEI